MSVNFTPAPVRSFNVDQLRVHVFASNEAMSAAVCSFPGIAEAVQAVIQTIQLGVPIARSEYLCENTIRAVNAASKLGLREQHTLFFEFHGSEASVREQAIIHALQIISDHLSSTI